MKKFTACALSVCMVAATLVGCEPKGQNQNANPNPDPDPIENPDPAPAPAPGGVIELYSFTDEVPTIVNHYIETHPDFGYTVNVTIKSSDEGAYQPALDMALPDSKNAPDIYTAESAFVLKYTQGDMSEYALPYKDLGIDVDAAIKAADIASYTIDIGTNTNGDLVGLGYQATGGAFIYRRSIAKDTWGTDDPATVKEKIGGGSGNWDKFWAAAEDLKGKGYAIVSGDGDIWHAVENSSDKGWIVDGKLYIDPKREAFMDISKKLVDNKYHNDTTDWTEGWFADMNANGTAFGFFGPAWLINYTIGQNCGTEEDGNSSFGDWAVCESPIGFFWGGTWIIASKYVPERGKTDAVKAIIEYITLDATADGLQAGWANGDLYGAGGTKDTVASGVVMSTANGEVEFLGGQNMFDVFVPANAAANGANLTQYDATINGYFREAVKNYAHGDSSYEDAIEFFKTQVKENLDVVVE